MEPIQRNNSYKLKPISFYHKFNCEYCDYHTNYKNSYNKHIKSAKHLSFTSKNEEQSDSGTNILEEQKQVDRNSVSDELQPEIIMDASMGFITVEEINKETKKDDTFQYSDDKIDKIVDLMESLNTSIKNDLRVKYFYTGMGFFSNFILFNSIILYLFIRSQRSDFFELSG
jgi:hypothetical protein